MKIRFLMKEPEAACRIDKLMFIAQKAIPPKFDSISEFFAPLDAPVPPSLLRDKNTIRITAQEGTAITSVQLVTFRGD